MDSLTKIRCGAALLALSAMPAIVLGVDKSAKDSGKPVPFISIKALNGLKDVGKAVEARGWTCPGFVDTTRSWLRIYPRAPQRV